MDQEAKKKWLNDVLKDIKAKNIQTPVKLNAATTIENLEMYLKTIEAAVLHYNNKKILKLFVDKLEQLKKL